MDIIDWLMVMIRMSEQRFIFYEYDDGTETIEDTEENEYYHFSNELVGLLNEQQATISKLEEEKGYWKSKVMTLLMQVRRLTSRMTDKEVKSFAAELEGDQDEE